MIGKVTYSSDFVRLNNYIFLGKEGTWEEFPVGKPNRVGSIETYNLESTDLRDFGKEMDETVTSLKQIAGGKLDQLEYPVMHLIVSFHKDDRVSQQQIHEMMNEVVSRLGLEDHQRMSVVHTDTEHPHIHSMINRVNLETGKAWERDFDYARIEGILRDIEKERGLTMVKSSQEIEHGSPSLSEIKKQGRLVGIAEQLGKTRFGYATYDDQTILQKTRDLIEELQSAENFKEFDELLAREGLYISTKGKGSVISDELTSVKCSRVSRDFSISKLEARFGEKLADYVKGRDSLVKELAKMRKEFL